MGAFDVVVGAMECPRCKLVNDFDHQIKFFEPDFGGYSNRYFSVGVMHPLDFDPIEYQRYDWDGEWVRICAPRDSSSVVFLADYDSQVSCFCGAMIAFAYEFALERENNASGRVTLTRLLPRVITDADAVEVDFAQAFWFYPRSEDPLLTLDRLFALDETVRKELLREGFKRSRTWPDPPEHSLEVHALTTCDGCGVLRSMRAGTSFTLADGKSRLLNETLFGVLRVGETVELHPDAMQFDDLPGVLRWRREPRKDTMVFAEWIHGWHCNCASRCDLFVHTYELDGTQATLVKASLRSSRSEEVLRSIDWSSAWMGRPYVQLPRELDARVSTFLAATML